MPPLDQSELTYLTSNRSSFGERDRKNDWPHPSDPEYNEIDEEAEPRQEDSD